MKDKLTSSFCYSLLIAHHSSLITVFITHHFFNHFSAVLGRVPVKATAPSVEVTVPLMVLPLL